MCFYQEEVIVLLHSISYGPVTAANAELSRYKKLQSALGMKQAFTLESYGAQIVEDVQLWCRVVIEIVAKRSRKLRDLAAVRSRSVVRCSSQVELGADDSHVSHWSNSDLFITPAIRIHHAKIAEPEICDRIKVCDVGLAQKREASTERGGSIPFGLRELTQEFVFAVFCPVGESHEEAKFAFQIEVAIERNDRTGRSV